MSSLLLVCILLVQLMAGSLATNETCVQTFKNVGCFKPVSKGDMVLALTARDHTSPNFTGKYLQWASFSEELLSFACRCNEKAEELKYEYFAIEYYAECWLLTKAPHDYDMKNATEGECVNGNLESCGHENRICAGKGFHQYIYKVCDGGIETEGGNANGACCQFPWMYNGEKKHNCIKDGNKGIPWCGTTSNYNRDKKYGNCVVPKVKCGISAKGGNNGDGCCKFPQKIPEGRFDACVTFQNAGVPWCATGDDYSKDAHWGNCVIPRGSENWIEIVFAPPQGLQVAKDKLVVSLQRLPKEFIIKTNITFDSISRNPSGIMDCMTNNSAIIVFSMYKGFGNIFAIDANINGRLGTMVQQLVFEKDKVIEVTVSQILTGGKYVFSAIINGRIMKTFENIGATSWGPTLCYASRNLQDLDPIPGKLHNGIIRIRGD